MVIAPSIGCYGCCTNGDRNCLCTQPALEFGACGKAFERKAVKR